LATAKAVAIRIGETGVPLAWPEVAFRRSALA
jgi:hypothetical protein